MSFQIFTDSTANLEKETAKELSIEVIPFTYHMNGCEYTLEDVKNFDDEAYYNLIRAGTSVTTSQINPSTYEEAFEKYLANGTDVMFISLSSGISGSFQSASVARDALLKKYPDRVISLIDTLGASLGEGLNVIRAAKCRQNGMSIRETEERILSLIRRTCQIFIVDDLMHLKRTGRLSNVGAIVGSVMGIKPILKGNENGKIVAVQKVRGRKNAIRTLAEKYADLIVNAHNQLIGISHANCPEDAEYLKSLILRKLPPKEIMMVKHEPVTGSHIGPSSLALYFEGADDVRMK